MQSPNALPLRILLSSSWFCYCTSRPLLFAWILSYVSWNSLEVVGEMVSCRTSWWLEVYITQPASRLGVRLQNPLQREYNTEMMVTLQRTGYLAQGLLHSMAGTQRPCRCSRLYQQHGCALLGTRLSPSRCWWRYAARRNALRFL